MKESILKDSRTPSTPSHPDLPTPPEARVASLADAERTILALKKSETRLRTLFDTMGEGVVVIDRDGRIVEVNYAAEEILGLHRSEIAAGSWTDPEWRILRPDGTAMPPEEMAGPRAMKEGRPVKDMEMGVVRADGTTRWVIASAAPILGTGGDPEGVVGTFIDITQRRKMDEVIERNEQFMRAILEYVPFGLILVDAATRTITTANAYAAAMIGLLPDGIVGHPCSTFIRSARVDRLRASIPGDLAESTERVLVTAEKREIPILNTMVEIDIQGSACILDCFVDLSDRKALETQLVHAQKLESVGRLAAGIAHEINTPAQYVGDNARFLKESFGQLAEVLGRYDEMREAVKRGAVDEALVQEIEQAIEAADVPYLLEEIPTAIDQSIDGILRISHIVRAMKEFAHPGTEAKVHTDLNGALATTITVSHNEWKYVADIETDFDPTLPVVPCLPGEMNQAFLNLIVNAAQAIEEGQRGTGEKGTISISTRRNGAFAEIRVKDTGPGIPESIRSRIMEPFFTTKEVGKGSGQGLAIVRSVVVDKHQGELKFETAPGKGTAFIIRLPLDDADATS